MLEDEEENTNPGYTKPTKEETPSPTDDVPQEEDLEPEEDEGEEESPKESKKDKNTTEPDAMAPKWDGRVMELTPDNFDHITNKFDAIMVNIYAPWCHHCQDFAPDYDEAA